MREILKNPSHEVIAALMAEARADEVRALNNMATRLADLVRKLKRFSFSQVAQPLAALLTRRENHTATARIEALIHLAALACRGPKRPRRRQLDDWLNHHLFKDPITAYEGPIEDVFVSNVDAWFGNARLFEGRWANNADYVQDCIGALLRLADRPWAAEALAHVAALLRASEAVAERAGVDRYARTTSQPRERIALRDSISRETCDRISFTDDELLGMGVQAEDLEPFIFRSENSDFLLGQSIGHSELERRPLLRSGKRITVVLPTAIGAAIRRFVIERAKVSGELNVLQSTLHLTQFTEVFLLGRADWGIRYLDGVEQFLNDDMREFVGTFDEGGYVHLLYVPDEFEEVAEQGFAKSHKLKDEVKDQMSSRARELADEPGYRRGLTVLVHGGIGREFSPVWGEFPSGWHQLCISAPDFMLLGCESDFTAIRAWKLAQQVDDLEDMGVVFPGLRGFLNLTAYAYYGDFELVPVNMEIAPIYLHNDLILPLRHRVRTALDRHTVIAPDGESWVSVQRETTGGHFSAPKGRPVFFSPSHRAHEELLACVETAKRAWWVHCTELPQTSWHRDLIFSVLELALNWLVRLAPVLEEQLPMLPAEPVTFRLRFPDIDVFRQFDLGEEEIFAAPVFAIDEGAITIDCMPPYLQSFLSPDNLGDRLMLDAMVRGTHLLCRAPIPAESVVSGLVETLVGSASARFLKMTQGKTPQDMIYDLAPLPELRSLMPEDLAWSRLDIARRAGWESKQGSVPPESAGPLLEQAVNCTWERIRLRLRGLSRESVIERSLLNFIAAQKEHRDRLRSMAAQAALFDRAQVHSEALRGVNRRDDASLACRVIAEMALCTSRHGSGTQCTRVDLDYLIAEVATLLECAGQKDALRYGLWAEQPIIHANGSFGFEKSPMRWTGDFRREHWTRTFRNSAVDDEAGIDRELGGENAAAEYESAFIAEFGLSTEQYMKFVLQVALEAIQKNDPHLRFRKSQVTTRLRDIGIVDPERVFGEFALTPRERWDEQNPSNAKARDWYPWRFNRRLSVLRRPLIQLSVEDDPVVLVFPSMLAHTLDYLKQAAFGRLPEEMFDSREMVSCIGRAADRCGHQFTRKVAERFELLEWKTMQEVALTQLGGGANLGDIDVLAWRPETGYVYLVECKSLRFDRTLSEIGERLAEYSVGTDGGKRTMLQKHLDRVSFLQTNLDQLLRITNIPAQELQLRSALVTEQLAPMQFSSKAREELDLVTDYELLQEALEG